MELQCGHVVVPEDEPKMLEDYPGCKALGFEKIQKDDFYVTCVYKKKHADLYNFKMYPSDVFVMCYPKTRSTLIQEIIWCILNNRDVDHPNREKHIDFRSPPFDASALIPEKDVPQMFREQINGDMSILQYYSIMEKPRVFKTHLYFSYMHPDFKKIPRIVYVIRDPREVCVSYYNYLKDLKFQRFQKPLADFVDNFIAGKTLYGSYVNHLKQWWVEKDLPNVHTVYFENFKENPLAQIKNLITFLGENLTDQQIENVIKYSSFEEMEKRDKESISKESKLQYFASGSSDEKFRKGTVGSSKSELTEEMREKISKHFRENLGEVELPYNLN